MVATAHFDNNHDLAKLAVDVSLWTKTWQKAEPSPLKTRTSASNSKWNIQRQPHFTIADKFSSTQFSPAFSETSYVCIAWGKSKPLLLRGYARLHFGDPA
jgi:hypothetical protein